MESVIVIAAIHRAGSNSSRRYGLCGMIRPWACTALVDHPGIEPGPAGYEPAARPSSQWSALALSQFPRLFVLFIKRSLENGKYQHIPVAQPPQLMHWAAAYACGQGFAPCIAPFALCVRTLWAVLTPEPLASTYSATAHFWLPRRSY